MKNFKLLAFTFLVVLFATTSSFAQGSFSFHFGPSIPSGNFADDDYKKWQDGSGGAALGLVAGIQYVYPLSENGLGLFAGVDLSYNGLTKNLRNDIEDDIDNNDIDITSPKYLNLPVSGGLNYTFKVNDKVSLYGKGGLVASFLKITNEKYSSGADDEYIQKSDLSTNLGYTFGGGLILNDKIEIGLTYMGLGDHKIDYTWDDGTDDGKGHYHQEVSLTTLTIGFKF